MQVFGANIEIKQVINANMEIIKSSNEHEYLGFKLGKQNAKDFVTKINEVLKKDVIMKLLGLETPLLTTWFGGKKFKLQVVYRATRDGFDAAKFHSLVDDQGPTLTVILSTNGFLFGGFTSKSWAHKNG